MAAEVWDVAVTRPEAKESVTEAWNACYPSPSGLQESYLNPTESLKSHRDRNGTSCYRGAF